MNLLNKENNEKKKKMAFATRSIHGPKKYALDVYGITNPVTTPIYMTSAFNVKQALNGVLPNYIYTRGSNPTITELQEKIADLENGEDCQAFGSGMAAISGTLLALGKKGTILADPEIYGGSHNLLKKQLINLRMKVKFVNFNNIEEVQNNITDDTKVLYFESPCNPTMKFIDIEEIVQIAKEKPGILTIFDNTLNSPYNLNPIDYGVDVVVHSCTKYISGHGDTLGGASITNKKINYKIMKSLQEFGGVISPFNAWLLLRGLKSLKVRMQQHNQNAQKLAEYLETRDDKIDKVLYPGLKSFSQYEIAKKYLKNGFGGVLSFYLKKGLNLSKFFSNLEIPAYTVSLGDTDTLIEDPFNLSHFGMPRKVKLSLGIMPYMVRVSVGIEDINDLISDFKKALDSV